MHPPKGSYPELIIRLDLLRRNAGSLVRALNDKGIEVRGVTKACHGDTNVASAMLGGGVTGLAESRARNLARLRAALPSADLAMLRPAAGCELDRALQETDLFLVGSEPMLKELEVMAEASGRAPRVILMLETGGGREGIPLTRAQRAIREAGRSASLELVGVGTHTSCGGAAPPPTFAEPLLELVERENGCFRTERPLVSAGNSAVLLPALRGELPGGVELRIGEAILLGRETSRGEELEGLRGDAFTLLAEVLETREERGEDGGFRQRLLVAAGRSDLGAGRMIPREPGMRVLEYFGDVTLIGVSAGSGIYRRGDAPAFSLDYQGVLGAMAGPYVSRGFRDEDAV